MGISGEGLLEVAAGIPIGSSEAFNKSAFNVLSGVLETGGTLINIMSNINNMGAYGGVVNKPLDFNIKPNLPDQVHSYLKKKDE